MSYAILRTAKLKSIGNIAGSLSHTYRTIPTPNANPQLTDQNINSHDTADLALEAIKAKIPAKHRSDAVLCIEYLITGSPEWEGWDTQKQQQYFDGAIDWLKDKHGADNVVMTGIQLDESTPHLVAYVVPLDDKGKLNAKKYLGGRDKLTAMQTDFAVKVANPLGLERGLEGSKATHTTIKQFYSDIQKPVPSIDDLQIVLPHKGVFERTEDYQNKVNNIVVQSVTPHLKRMQALQNAVGIMEGELEKTNKQLAEMSKNTEIYRKARYAVGVFGGSLGIHDFDNDIAKKGQAIFKAGQDEFARSIHARDEARKQELRQAELNRPRPFEPPRPKPQPKPEKEDIKEEWRPKPDIEPPPQPVPLMPKPEPEPVPQPTEQKPAPAPAYRPRRP